MKAEDHEWQMKRSIVTPAMLANPLFCADALRKMVANCVALHATNQSLYTDGERKVMIAAAEHIENLYSASPHPRS